MADDIKRPEFRVFLHNGDQGKVHLLFLGAPADVCAGLLAAMETSVPFKCAVMMAASDLLERSHPILSDDLMNIVKSYIPELEDRMKQGTYFTDN